MKNQINEHVKMWNLNQPGGWDLYKELTEDNKTDPNKLMDKINKIINKVKFKAFGKVRYKKNNNRKNKDLVKLIKEKIKLVQSDNNGENEEVINHFTFPFEFLLFYQ